MKTMSVSLSVLSLSVAFMFTACNNPEVGGNVGDIPPPTQQPVAGAPELEFEEANKPELTPENPVDNTEMDKVPVQPVPEIPAFELKAAPAVTYTVKKGDNPWTIANMYGVSVNELIAENHLTQKATLKVGQKLTIPAGGAYLPPEKRKKYVVQTPKKVVSSSHKVKTTNTQTTSTQVVNTVAGEYTVAAGDYPEKIARKHKITTSALMAANPGLNPNKMQVGQKIKIPGGTTVTTTSMEATTGGNKTTTTNTTNHVETTTTEAETTNVAPVPPVNANTQPISAVEGETLRSISSDFFIPLADIKELNPTLKEDQPLRAGTVVIIPKQ